MKPHKFPSVSTPCFLFLLFACLFLKAILGDDSVGGRIVNGTEIVPHSYPWLANLGIMQYGYKHPPFCGATILNAEWVISASHCSYRYGEDVYITAGDHDNTVDEGTEQVRVYYEKVHLKTETPKGYSDILLVHVLPPFEFNEFVQPAKLPPEDFIVEGTVKEIGWGQTLGSSLRSHVPREVEVEVVGNEECQKQWLEYRNGELNPGETIQDDMVCAGRGKGKGACYGDSGGPMKYDKDGETYVVGVASQGHDGCDKTAFVPDVYIRISSYVTKINKAMHTFRKKPLDGIVLILYLIVHLYALF